MQANIDEHWTNVDLIYPITGVKIIQPVRLPLCDDVFDRIGVLKKIKGMNDIKLIPKDLGLGYVHCSSIHHKT